MPWRTDITAPLEDGPGLLRRIQALALPLDRELLTQHSKLAVLSGCGDTETGFHGEGPRFQPVRHADAIYVLHSERNRVTRQFLAELEKIAEGIQEGYFVDDGSEQFAVALIVADGGVDEPLVPLVGISVQCSPADMRNPLVTQHDLDGAWDDFADWDIVLENESSEVPELTIRAYRAAVYHVGSEPPFCLKIDQPSHDLKDVYASLGVETAAFLTACNPVGRPLRLETNEDRQRLLRADLKSANLRFIDGNGCDPEGKWAGEASFLVLGISLEQAEALGAKYKQNAILWVGDDAVPSLILLR